MFNIDTGSDLNGLTDIVIQNWAIVFLIISPTLCSTTLEYTKKNVSDDISDKKLKWAMILISVVWQILSLEVKFLIYRSNALLYIFGANKQNIVYYISNKRFWQINCLTDTLI